MSLRLSTASFHSFTFPHSPPPARKPLLRDPAVCRASPAPDHPPAPGQDPETTAFAAAASKACGREEVERGCDREGRIQGGIGTVPGFGWWPIKAYRPCPAFVAAGGRYRRRGQSMDEVASGGSKRRSKIVATTTDTPSSEG